MINILLPEGGVHFVARKLMLVRVKEKRPKRAHAKEDPFSTFLLFFSEKTKNKTRRSKKQEARGCQMEGLYRWVGWGCSKTQQFIKAQVVCIAESWIERCKQGTLRRRGMLGAQCSGHLNTKVCAFSFFFFLFSLSHIKRYFTFTEGLWRCKRMSCIQVKGRLLGKVNCIQWIDVRIQIHIPIHICVYIYYMSYVSYF
jgi:hypothetical protein